MTTTTTMTTTTPTNSLKAPPRSARKAALRWPLLLLSSAALANAGCLDRPNILDPGERRAAMPGPAPASAGTEPEAALVRSPTAQPRARAAFLGAVLDEPAGDPGVQAERDARAEGGPEADADDETEGQMWEVLEETFGRKGELRDGVYRLVTPRTDLFVTMDGMDVPGGAFLESDFRFWRCPCGKLLVNGQFVLADYEVNDVVDGLQEGRLDVVAIAPLLLHEHPRLLMVRFQGEGRTRAFAEALKSALGYTGDARNAPQPVDLSPDPAR